MLLISNVVLSVTLGVSGLLSLLRVVWVALHTPTEVEPCRHILVLGVKLRDCQLCEDYCHRLLRAAQLLQDERGEQLLLLGGETSRHCHSEAMAGAQFLQQRGIAPDRLLLEEGSRHTLENLRNIRPTLQPGEASTIVTNRYHLARTGAMATGLSLPHRLCAAELRLVPTPTTLLKLLLEAYYLHWYYSGAWWARLIGDKTSLAHIS